MDYITRQEHEEFRISIDTNTRRLDEYNKRQDRRLELLEENVSKLETLTTSVEKLAINMENMVREQTKQGARLETLEARDGEKWRKTVGYIVSAVIGGMVTFVVSYLLAVI